MYKLVTPSSLKREAIWTIDGKVVEALAKIYAIALDLLSHIVNGVFRSFAIIFIHCHEIRKIQHVDFFKLALGTEF